MTTPPPAVAAVFAAYPPAVRETLERVRALILQTAAATPGVGPLEETLKWGEPAYLTPVSRSGSTIRLGWRDGAPARCVLYFNCKTDLLDRFRTLLTGELEFEGDRAVLFPVGPPPSDALAACVAMALRYHLDRRRRA
ncbi:hypothetical protein QO010_004352 [Caulobacter ginsengisoli]|uniref:YdhG-like domain-containing protein n=1 Tax=Caulobacter ginsengisoli TaxID=400775 RepID=A0ABU0IX22_9CAUL|nr:DUF1801 domain-containing protein [Caulobacter ginsengisoli]MDQ0466557.1 hypothetical protein [Caulobacter ginsengisoli]